MPRPLVHATAFALAAAFTFAAHAQAGKATSAEAIAMVHKGIAFVKENGREKAFSEITNRAGRFVDRDLYLAVHDMDGVVRAHGANETLIGKNLIDFRDADGKPFVKERLELARQQPSFWQDYKYLHPITRQIAPKRMYCERLDDIVVCGGVYR